MLRTPSIIIFVGLFTFAIKNGLNLDIPTGNIVLIIGAMITIVLAVLSEFKGKKIMHWRKAPIPKLSKKDE